MATTHHTMIIPVRCFTCGKVIADKWLHYDRLSSSSDPEASTQASQDAKAPDLRTKTLEGRVLDELGLVRVCCRRHFLTHVNLIDDI